MIYEYEELLKFMQEKQDIFVVNDNIISVGKITAIDDMRSVTSQVETDIESYRVCNITIRNSKDQAVRANNAFITAKQAKDYIIINADASIALSEQTKIKAAEQQKNLEDVGKGV